MASVISCKPAVTYACPGCLPHSGHLRRIKSETQAFKQLFSMLSHREAPMPDSPQRTQKGQLHNVAMQRIDHDADVTTMHASGPAQKRLFRLLIPIKLCRRRRSSWSCFSYVSVALLRHAHACITTLQLYLVYCYQALLFAPPRVSEPCNARTRMHTHTHTHGETPSNSSGASVVTP